MSYRIEGPPLPDGVHVGDEIWIPLFADAASGWMLVQRSGPVEGGCQRVAGIRTMPPTGDVEVTLPLAWTYRRVEVPDVPRR